MGLALAMKDVLGQSYKDVRSREDSEMEAFDARRRQNGLRIIGATEMDGAMKTEWAEMDAFDARWR